MPIFAGTYTTTQNLNTFNNVFTSGSIVDVTSGFGITSTRDARDVTFAGTMLVRDDGIVIADGNNTSSDTDVVLTGLMTTTRDGIVVDGYDRVTVSGTIDANNIGISTTGTFNNVVVATGGTVVSTVSEGVDLTGIKHYLSVAGTVVAHNDGTTSDAGVRLNASDSRVDVSGTVTSVKGDGLSLTSSATNATVTVSGTVNGGDDGIQTSATTNVTVTGLVNGQDVGFVSGGSLDMSVSGTIEGQSGAGIDVNTSGEITITGTGVVRGGPYGIDARDATSRTTIYNDGTIAVDAGGASGLEGVVSGDASLALYNTGTIIGEVSLGGGSDLYDASGGDGVVTSRIFMGTGDDTFRGGSADETAFAGNDNDVLDGGAGNDRLFGSNGNDAFIGTLDGDSDLYSGGNDTDTVDYSDALANLQVNLNAVGGFASSAEIGFDQLIGVENAEGGSGDDSLVGDSGANALSGGAGNDRLVGGAGGDRLEGGAGDDVLTGAFNADRFVFDSAFPREGNGPPISFGNDTITDFEATNVFERIDLSRVAQITDFNDLVNNHLTAASGNVVIDTGGPTDTRSTITLLGVNQADLDASDFVF